MRISFIAAISMFFFIACNNADKEKTTVKDTTASTQAPAPQQEPIINVEELDVKPMQLLIMKDSAKSTEEIGQKLGMIYAKIGDCLKNCKMEMAGAPMAMYTSQTAPFYFEAGVPIAKKCDKPESGMKNQEIKAGKAIVAHFFGPYEMTPKGYDAIVNWAKANNKTLTGDSWEIYIGDPVIIKDPYKVQTDIYMRIK